MGCPRCYNGGLFTERSHVDLIHKFRDAIKEKPHGKLRRKGLLLQDNATSYKPLVVMAAISIEGFKLLDHLPYPPDLAPSDNRLFPKLEEHLPGKKCSSDNEAMLSVNQWFAEVGHPSSRKL